MVAERGSVVGEPLMNWRFVPAQVNVRLRTSWFSSHGSRPFSSRKFFSGARSFCSVKHRLDGAAFLAAADERAVGAFAEDEVERAEDDGFARAGFAGDDVAAGLEFQREVAHEGEVFDAQRRQHGQFRPLNLEMMHRLAKRKYRGRDQMRRPYRKEKGHRTFAQWPEIRLVE